MRIEMLKGLSAILAAAVCAGVIIGFVPQPESAAAAATPRAIPRNEQSNVAINSAPVVATASACTQTWPYYEQSCLRDLRQVGRAAPTARIIPSTYPVKAPVSKIARLAGGSR
jgi:hypothetical protein